MYANPIIGTTFIYADYLYNNLISSGILKADTFLSIGSVIFSSRENPRLVTILLKSVSFVSVGALMCGYIYTVKK